ncbi:MAG: TetR/AcrR family transcriptional regulator [Bacteroidia bacterium]|nr:TetR/AcrR family transcriptional regulator [Bacteroidia bacterium]
MPKRYSPDKKDINTEEKIKIAARSVFHKKGFVATRTRDIALEAGINLALLNYYFRSKEKLFDIIMAETLHTFVASLISVLNDESTSLQHKVEAFTKAYIEMLIREPEIPIFIMSEMHHHPDKLLARLNAKALLFESAFAKQYVQEFEKKNIAAMPMLQFLMNILGLTVFPFVASPLLKKIGNLSGNEFNALMKERIKRIPEWISLIMNPDAHP